MEIIMPTLPAIDVFNVSARLTPQYISCANGVFTSTERTFFNGFPLVLVRSPYASEQELNYSPHDLALCVISHPLNTFNIQMTAVVHTCKVIFSFIIKRVRIV